MESFNSFGTWELMQVVARCKYSPGWVSGNPHELHDTAAVNHDRPTELGLPCVSRRRGTARHMDGSFSHDSPPRSHKRVRLVGFACAYRRADFSCISVAIPSRHFSTSLSQRPVVKRRFIILPSACLVQNCAQCGFTVRRRHQARASGSAALHRFPVIFPVRSARSNVVAAASRTEMGRWTPLASCAPGLQRGRGGEVE